MAVALVLLLAISNHLRLTSGEAVSAPSLKLNDGRSIPAIALGTWLGHNVEPSSTSDVERAVSGALEAGYRHVDTASRYHVEDQVGRGLAAGMASGIKREDIFVTTKLWNDMHARAAVVPALRASLRRLGLEYVDLYLIHWPVGQFTNLTYDHTDYVATWRGVLAARRLGLARSVGLSNFNELMMDRIRASGLEPPAVLQVEINLNLQQPSLLAYCRRNNVTVMGYSPFGSLFPGRAQAGAPPPRADHPALLTIAARHNKTVPQVALRYLVELGVIPIPKSVTKSRIQQNIDIFDFQLSGDERDTLRQFDNNYRTIPQLKWLDHPYYPFDKKE